MLPQIDKNLLIDLGGWDLLKDAKALARTKVVQYFEWDEPYLRGKLRSSGAVFHPRVEIKPGRVPTSECNCRKGQSGYVCIHAMALAYHVMESQDVKEEALSSPKDAELKLKSFVLSDDAETLFFRFLLPPNLSQVAQKDAIAVKVVAIAGDEAVTPQKLSGAFRMENSHAIVAALLESWSGGKIPGFLQLDRMKLAQLLAILSGEPCFAWVRSPDVPISWSDSELEGVSTYLKMPNITSDDGVVKPEKPKPDPHRVERSTGSRMLVDGSPSYLAVQLPERGNPEYSDALSLLKQWGFKLEPSNRRWWLRDKSRTLKFLAEHWDELDCNFAAEFSHGFQKRMASVQRIKAEAQVHELGGGEFEVDLSLSAGDLCEADLHRAMATSASFVESGKGIFLIDAKQLAPLQQAQQSLTNQPDRTLAPKVKLRLGPADLHSAEELLEETVEDFVPPDEWQRRSAALRDVSKLEPAPIASGLDNRLRNYQRVGVAWMWHLYRQEIGGILADEMGLGKTIQALALLQAIGKGPYLVVCPASLGENWRREALRFIPDFRVRVHRGPSRARNPQDLEDCDLIIVSYPLLARDLSLFHQMRFSCVIGDEGQHIKNPRSQVAKAICSLRSDGRFLLTGTPIENSLSDLRSLFHFLTPGYLAKVPEGLKPDERKWFEHRHLSQAAPYILRRGKALVAPELPEVIEQVVYCEMGQAQRGLYNAVHQQTERDLLDLAGGGAQQGRMRMAVFAQILKLRQICAEPRLVDDKLKLEDSAKLEVFLEVLDDAITGGHRILVFSQFVQVLQKIRAALDARSLSYCYLDGQTRDRMAQVDRFQHDASIPVFLISLKAGGTGLNLTGADMVVHFDPWWNPAAEAQATARAHRIGQERKVTSLKLIASNTIEERVLHLQKEKAELLDTLFEESGQNNAQVGFADLQELLAEGPLA